MTESKAHAELVLRELMRDRDEGLVKLALAARKAVLKVAGACSELIYETYCVSNAFSYTGKQGEGFIHIATYAGHVNLGFDHGTKFDDPQGLLKGTGKRIRHIRLGSVADLKQDPVIRLIAQAVEHGLAMAEQKGGVVGAKLIVKRRSS